MLGFLHSSLESSSPNDLLWALRRHRKWVKRSVLEYE